MKIEYLQPANEKKVTEVANEKGISDSVNSEVKEKINNENKEDLKIVCEEAVMKVDNRVIAHDKITAD